MARFWRNQLLRLGLLGCRPVADLVLVSGSDSSHAASLGDWLASVARHEPQARVIVYDLGLSQAELARLPQAHPRVEIRRFAFEKYPGYFDIKVAAGQYAWKPAIIHEVMEEAGKPLCWMDAGNLLLQPLQRIRSILARYGFYSPRSQGRIRDWTHPATLAALHFPAARLARRNLNGACVAFDSRNPSARQLLAAWFHASLQQDIIAPPGSDRSNHRQDQAVLSALFHQSATSDRLLLRLAGGFEYQGFLTHQDDKARARVR